MILIPYLLVILVISLISLLFVLTGMMVYKYSILDYKNHSFAFKFGISYFLGMGFFLTSWRLLSFIFNSALIPLILSFLSLILVCLIKNGIKEDIHQIIIGIKQKKYLIFLFLFIIIFELLFWLQSYQNVWSVFGSLHSGRYVNIAQYIIEFNRIPIIGQNYGQSMLSSILMFIGLKYPFLALNIWLSTSIFYLCISIYGFFKILKLSTKISIVGTFILMFGNTALSLTHILVIDSGSPLLMNGYTDSIFSVATILLFLVWFNSISICVNKTKNTLFRSFPILFIFGISWNITAPQNIIISLSLLLLIVLANYKGIFNKNRILVYSIFILLLFSLIGLTQGGMLSPQIVRDDIKLPGLMEATISSNIFIRPELPYHFGIGGHWHYGTTSDETFRKIKFLNWYWSPHLINKIIFTVETNLWNSIRVAFFPILGIIVLGVLIKNKKYEYRENEQNTIKTLFEFAAITFIVGFLIAFFISIYKWEFSRFLIPGYFFGMISLVLVINAYLEKLKSNTNRYILLLILVLIITTGPIVDSLAHIFINVFNIAENYTFLERIRMLVELSGIIY